MTEPPSATSISAAALAERHGLSRSGARPSLPAYAGQLWGRRHFILTYAQSRVRAQYSASFLGQLWQVLTPLLNAAVYFFVFGLLLNANRGVENYPAFLVAGVFIFTYTQRAVLAGAQSIAGNLGLVRALHFPRATLPLAATVVELQQLLISTLVLFAIVLATGEPLTPNWLLIVPAMLLQTLFNSGLALVFARLTSRIADLTQLLPFLLRTWQYVSGVFWSVDVFAADAPGVVRFVLEVNPAGVYIEIVRDALMESHTAGPHVWPLALGWAVVSFASGFVYFWRAEERYGRG